MGAELLAIAALLFASIAIQALALTLLRRRVTAIKPWMQRHTGFMPELILMYGVIVAVVAMHVMQAIVWAAFYFAVVGIAPVRDAFYHSLLSLTTMDDSAGVLPERWRLLGAAEGLTGWIVFSWSTGWVMMFLTSLHELRRGGSDT
jgi:hypothetical protein